MTTKHDSVALFEKVLAKTRERKIRWEKTAATNTRIAALGDKYSLTIGYAEDEMTGETTDVWLALNDRHGERILTVSPSTDRISRDDLEELFELAHRSSVGADDKVDEALKLLSSLD